jgi:hypothetical protein
MNRSLIILLVGLFLMATTAAFFGGMLLVHYEYRRNPVNIEALWNRMQDLDKRQKEFSGYITSRLGPDQALRNKGKSPGKAKPLENEIPNDAPAVNQSP